MKPRPKQPPPEDSEDWLVTYADAITLLMAFFVMLVSFSKIDIPLFEQVQAGIKQELTGQTETEQPLFQLFTTINSVLDGNPVIQENAEVGFDDKGVVIEFANQSFFKPASAELMPQAEEVLDEFAKELVLPAYELYFVEVEGHTDDVAINTAQFPSNWELSAARAARVIRHFIDKGLFPERMKAAGYADIRPKLPNRDMFGEPLPENQAENRRVVIRLFP